MSKELEQLEFWIKKQLPFLDKESKPAFMMVLSKLSELKASDVEEEVNKTILCPRCQGVNQYSKNGNEYKCAYTDCRHEWIQI